MDGTAARNLLDAPGYRDVDMGTFRTFALRDRFNLQARAEFTNFFNLVSLNAPNSMLSSSAVGQITSAQPMQIATGAKTDVLTRRWPVKLWKLS